MKGFTLQRLVASVGPRARAAFGARVTALTLLAAFSLLAACTGTGITGSTYQGHVFKIIATSGYAGNLVEDSGTTPIAGSADLSIPITASSGQQYTLTVWKTGTDSQPLTVELVANETVNGVPTTVVVESGMTTSAITPVRVGLTE